MEKHKIIILGAGPAGLAFANRIHEAGVRDFLVLEKEETAGGLCRSVDVDGAPLDIGGGHFLDVRRPHVNRFLFKYMPESEWDKYERDSRICINGKMIDHPIEANIWQMDLADQVQYLKSIAVAGCNLGTKMPENFVDWIYWKLGTKIADEYMIPYNQKMFGKELDQLGTYWLEKLPSVSFEETLLSCLEKKAYGTQPGHAQFYYPKKYGYGELWLRMADAIKEHIKYNAYVKGIDLMAKKITTLSGDIYQADMIITTIPWLEFDEILGMPDKIRKGINELRTSAIQIEYFPLMLDTLSHWIYYPDPRITYHRILVRHNFCLGSRGYWTETNSQRIDQGSSDDHFKYINQYAYPLNTVKKTEIMKDLLTCCESYDVIGLGRWGEHQHYNSDVTVDRAMKQADSLIKGGRFL